MLTFCFVVALAHRFRVILIKYCVSWYFDSKVDRNNRELIKLRREKKEILQNVMDKETYKVALEILNTFGDQSMKIKPAHELSKSAWQFFFATMKSSS